MIRSLLCGLAAVIFIYAGATFPGYNIVVDSVGDSTIAEAATAVAGTMQWLLLGLGLLAAGNIDWTWVGKRLESIDR
jgi:hypothetical protein